MRSVKAEPINMGNYESARADVRMSAQLDDEEDFQECLKQLSREVEARLEKEVALIEIEMGVDEK